MAQIGTTPAANRYAGLGTGPAFAYTFETQEGIPVDGTNTSLSNYSPFVLRLIPPDALLEASASSGGEAVDLIQAAALGSSTTAQSNATSRALSGVLATGAGRPSGQLASFVANGQFFTGANAAFVSSIADATQAADIALQLQYILNAEPLVLLVSPTSMSVQYTKTQSYQSRARHGFIFEAWGEEQPTLSFSGTTAGFVAGVTDISNPFAGQVTGSSASVSGYQEAARRDSAAWQNFQSLYLFYKNNGYIYDTVGRSQAHLFVGSVAIDYDQWTYVGHIESFSYRFDEANPLRVEFDLEFKASRVYDRSASTAAVSPLQQAGARVGMSFSSGLAGATSPVDSEFAQPPLDGLVGGS